MGPGIAELLNVPCVDLCIFPAVSIGTVGAGLLISCPNGTPGNVGVAKGMLV